MKNLTTKQILEWVIITLFMSLLSAPAIIMLVTPDVEKSNAELRFLAKSPNFEDNSDFKSYTIAFENYVNDQFGLREVFLQLNSYMNYYIFSVTGAENVIIGKNGWLFFNEKSWNSNNIRIIDDYRGIAPPLQKSGLGNLQKRLESQRDFLEQHQILFYLVIPPNKHSIYGQYLPDVYSRKGGSTYYDQVMNYLTENSNIHVIDMHQSVKDASGAEQLYYKYDTHWNSYGAFIGYREIIKSIQNDIETLPIIETPHYQTQPTDRLGDLAQMARLSLFDKRIDAIAPTCTTTVYDKFQSSERFDINIHNCAVDSEQLSLLLFHDSYSYSMLPFLKYSFSKIITVHGEYDEKQVQQLIEDFDIDVVIEQWLERKIIHTLPNIENPN